MCGVVVFRGRERLDERRLKNRCKCKTHTQLDEFRHFIVVFVRKERVERNGAWIVRAVDGVQDVLQRWPEDGFVVFGLNEVRDARNPTRT